MVATYCWDMPEEQTAPPREENMSVTYTMDLSQSEHLGANVG
jgi:hypothetical protein